MRTTLIGGLAALLLVFFAAGTPAQGKSADKKPSGVRVDHAVFDGILRRHVRDERVDYLLLRKHDMAALVGYIEALAAVDVAKLPRAERLVLYLNLYNAGMIRAVAERLHAGYSPSADGFAIFDEKLLRVAGKKISLNQLENEIIRPEFGEPRIHVALVCGARSCPPLLPRAYRVADLDTVLEANMKRFLADRFRNRVERGRKRLELSRIFDWYKVDFGGAAGVPRYVDRFVDGAAVAGYRVGFLDYSWELNIAPPAKGRWIAVAKAVDLAAEAGGAASGERVAPNQLFEVLASRDGWLQLARPAGAAARWIREADTRAYTGAKKKR